MGQTAGNRIRGAIPRQQWLPALMMGTVAGVIEVIYALSIASLIFKGDLAIFLPYGFGISLISSVVLLIGTALTSSIPGVFSSTQDTSTVVIATMVAALAGTLVSVGNAEKLATILAAIALSTVLTGLFFFTLGSVGLGKLVRYMPYPVIGGFLAGTGWLLVQGSFGVMADASLSVSSLPALLRPDQLLLWVPGVIFALILFFGLQRFEHFLTMPALFTGSIAVFYGVLLVTGTSIPAATARGLLLGPVGGEAHWPPLALGSPLLAANWRAILGQSSHIAIVLALSVMGFLLNASALELTLRQDISLNSELKAAGVAILVSGLLGGLVGYPFVGDTALNVRVGARGKLPGIVTGLVCAAAFLLGSPWLAYLPRPLLGGLLFFLGLQFLVEWVIHGWKKLSRGDYCVTLLILAVVASTNFLTGVGVGLIAAVVLFVVQYSQIKTVRQALSGAEMASNVGRCAYHQRVLQNQLGQHIYILELEGYLFFGTANALVEQVRARLDDTTQPPTRYLLLDFRRVSGFDSSAVVSLVKCRQFTEIRGTTLVLTNLSKSARQRLAVDGFAEAQPGLRLFPDLDHGLEWCEEQLLELEQVTRLHLPITLVAQLADCGFESADTRRLLKYLDRITFQAGEALLRQGEAADRLYFIEMGSVSVHLDAGEQTPLRLQTLGLGTAVGEAGLYLDATCSTSVIADMPVTAYRLTRARLAEMKAKEPELAATFHELAARLLAERLTTTTRTLQAVLR